MALEVPFERRDVLMAADPRACYITDHYRAYPWMLVRLAECLPTHSPHC